MCTCQSFRRGARPGRRRTLLLIGRVIPPVIGRLSSIRAIQSETAIDGISLRSKKISLSQFGICRAQLVARRGAVLNMSEASMRVTPILIGAIALAGAGLGVASSNPREPGSSQAQAQPAAPPQARRSGTGRGRAAGSGPDPHARTEGRRRHHRRVRESLRFARTQRPWPTSSPTMWW